MMQKRTWIDIDLDALVSNYHTACSLTKSTVTCVLKANAYGHGAVMIAKVLQREDCRSFAVSCIREGLQLRQAGITGEILVMGLAEAPLLEAAIAQDLILTAARLEDIQAIEQAAAAANKQAVCHIKVDTGFHRLGFECTEEQAGQIVQALKQTSHCTAAGLYSHLGLINTGLDTLQYQRLMQMQGYLSAQGLLLEDVHICDSIGLVRYPAWHGSRVRVGALLFGVRPSRSDHMPFTCLETLRFCTSIAQLHDVARNEIVGYGDDMPLTRDSRIATICVGYGDGYPRSLSNGNGQVLIRDKLCPVIGLICMDQTMVDVTDVPDVQEGDTVVLLGGGIDYMTYSNWCHTNRNECLTILSQRPQRVYHAYGQVLCETDGLLDAKGPEA